MSLKHDDRTRLIVPSVFFLGSFVQMKVTGSTIVKRKSKLIPSLIVTFLVLIVVVAASVFAIKIIRHHLKDAPSVSALEAAWSEYNYSSVYDISHKLLQENPYDNRALIYHGYASFYLAMSQTDTSLAQNYLDEAINCMRIALYKAKKQIRPQLEYMLGKAYFYKNTITSYYYADLALKYLSLSKEHGYQADDTAEYMGLSYAALGEPMESIAAFSEALLVRESDSLLLSIAEQYYKAGQATAAKQYLFRIKNESSDDDVVLKSRNLLGTIYIDEKNYDEARTEFEAILKKNQNSADAFYGLGVIYEKQGDLVKARAEWRKALRVQVNHALALEKMAHYK